MPYPLPRMTSHPPDSYVAFVAGHLDAVRRAAAEAVGDEHHADLLYPDAFTDVASRWDRLRLCRPGPGRSAAAEALLWRAFDLRLRRWRTAMTDRAAGESPWELDVRVWGPDGPPPRRRGATPPARTSVALRLVRTGPARPAARPAAAVAEAAIAWWHAYEARRRRWRVVAAIAVLLALLLLARLYAGMAG